MHGRPLRILLALSVALAPLSASAQERYYFRNVQGSASGQTNPNPTPANPASISVPATINAQVGDAVNVVPSVSNLSAPVAWSYTGTLPANFSVSPTTGAITGSPQGSGTFDIVLRAESGARSAQAPVRLVLTNPAPNPPVIGSYQSSFEFFEGEAFTIPAPGVTGGTPPYAYSIAPGTFPFSFSTSTGAVSWSNPVAGSYPNNVVTVVGGNSSNPFSITVRANLVASAYAPRTSGAYQPFNIAPPSVTGGTPPYSFSGSLPAGMTLQPNGGITGTINTPGSYAGSVTVSDSSTPQRSTTASYSVNVTAPDALSLNLSASIPAEAMVGVPMTAISAIVSGGVAPYNYSLAGTAPAGITLSGSSLSGTPSIAGTFTYGIAVSDSQSPAASQSSTATTLVYPAFTAALSGSIPSTAFTGQPITPVSLTVEGGKGPYSFASTGLPDGMTFTSGGVLQGAPSAPGTYEFTLTATESFASQVRSFGPYTLTVSTPQTLEVSASSALPTEAMVGQAITSVSFQHTGGVGSVTYDIVGSAPAGVQMVGSTLQGTPQAGTAGSYTFFVQGTDSAASPNTDMVQVSLTVYDTFTAAVSATPQSTVTVGTAIANVNLVPSGGKGPYVYSTTGTLPTGVTFSNAGLLSGAPQVTGNFSYKLRVTHSYTGAVPFETPTYTLTVNDTPAIAIAPATPQAHATRTVAITPTNLNPSGGNGQYTFALVGNPPPGLGFTGNQLTGTPTTNGDYSFQIRVTDTTPGTPKTVLSSSTYAMAVRDPVSMTSTVLANATANVAYSFQLTASGGQAPYTFTVTGLPGTLTSSSSGLVTGTPTEAQNYTNLQIRATDSVGRQSTLTTASLTVLPPPAAAIPRPDTVSAPAIDGGQGVWVGAVGANALYDASTSTAARSYSGYEGGGFPRALFQYNWTAAHKMNCVIVGFENSGAAMQFGVAFRLNGNPVGTLVNRTIPSGFSTEVYQLTGTTGSPDINQLLPQAGGPHTNYRIHTFKAGAWDGTTCITSS